MERLLSAPLFFFLFGLMFLVIAVRRLAGVAREERKGEAVVWGTVGLIIALAFIAVGVWFVTGERSEIDRKWLEIESRRGGP